MTALVTCGETRQSLAAVRALGRAGIPVALCAKKRPTLAMWSQFASSTFLTEDPKVHAHQYAQHLGFELKARYAHCILVASDDALWALSRFRELLPVSARRILPPHYSVVRSLDHEALHYFAESLEIPCTRLWRVPQESTPEVVAEVVADLRFPIMIRPSISWIEREDGSRTVGLRSVCKTKSHLMKYLSQNPSLLTHGFLISAYTTKRALSYFGVADRGEVLVEGFQERIREQEPYNEVATVAMTIPPMAKMRDYARLLIHALNWQGPFKVEFAKEHDGSLRLISLIGRLWGSTQLAISSGVNVPLICYRLAEGTLTKDVLKNARANVKMHWLVGDASSWLNMGPSLMKNVWQLGSELTPHAIFERMRRHKKVTTCYDVLDFEDPMPFLFELQHNTWRRAFALK